VMTLLERLVALWTQPVGSRDDAEAAFREVYADSVVVNGTEMPVADLVSRARALQEAFDGLGMDILDTVETPDRIVIAFHMRGRHVGPYVSPLGWWRRRGGTLRCARSTFSRSPRVSSPRSGLSLMTSACFASSMPSSWRDTRQGPTRGS
jgi:hypothetical protein